MKRKQSTEPERPISVGRHEHACKVCNHLERRQIEVDFVSWKSPQGICDEYGLKDRTTIYRHAWALGLMEKRRRNVRAALECIIERAADVEVTAAAVVQAVTAYARINAEGRLVERSERVDLNSLFEKMTRDELRKYAETGELPDWFEQTVGKTTQPATPEQSLGDADAF